MVQPDGSIHEYVDVYDDRVSCEDTAHQANALPDVVYAYCQIDEVTP